MNAGGCTRFGAAKQDRDRTNAPNAGRGRLEATRLVGLFHAEGHDRFGSAAFSLSLAWCSPMRWIMDTEEPYG